jgi:hypothetical protein
MEAGIEQERQPVLEVYRVEMDGELHFDRL